jgi:hypothetical protein
MGPKRTSVTPTNPSPVIDTWVPTVPEAGLIALITGAVLPGADIEISSQAKPIFL